LANRQTLFGTCLLVECVQPFNLLVAMFGEGQIVADSEQTAANHSSALLRLDLPAKVGVMFEEEFCRVTNALDDGGAKMLAILPGKTY
jgi:hypothetical protein